MFEKRDKYVNEEDRAGLVVFDQKRDPRASKMV
jgi:hypothetical protein